MRQTDFCRFVFKDGSRIDFMCSELMVQWPPPKFLNLVGRNFQQVSCSKLTEVQAETMEIARGALYYHIPDVYIKEESDADSGTEGQICLLS